MTDLTSLTTSDWVALATTVTVVGGAVALIWKGIVPVFRTLKKLVSSLSRFIEDWFGDEESPGKSRTPGVMERLNKIDGELKHNGGSTMKDALKRVELSVEQIKNNQEVLTTNQETLKENQTIITSWMAGIDARMGRFEKETAND